MSESFSADLHIHGTYSGATSDKMILDIIAQQASFKGLTFVGTGDFLHPSWMKQVQAKLEIVEEGTFEHPRFGTRFILTVEVEDDRRVHHLIISPSISSAEGLYEEFSKHSKDINLDGRPSLNLSAPEIVEISRDHDCLVGPSHAFTPWTSIYKEFDSISSCYEDQVDKLAFLELGLSADTLMADRLMELESVPFLSNSDAHSPWPNKLGREFNRFELSRPVSSEMIESIKEKKGISLNVGLDPKLGKYHMTACSKCYSQFLAKDAEKYGWRCKSCGGVVKKGVLDRVSELADFESPLHPDFRPDYLRIAPLSEVIALALGCSNPRSRKVRRTWNRLIEHFKDEITVLVDADLAEIEETSGPQVALIIGLFRKRQLDIDPGGGGRYGRLKIPEELIKAQRPGGQRTIAEFS